MMKFRFSKIPARLLLVSCLLVSNFSGHASRGSVIKLVSWNLLNWPNASDLVNDTTTRCPYYRAVMQAMEPTLVVTMENQGTTSVPWFLNQVLNVNTNAYRQAVYINGPDSNNGLFYLDSVFQFVSNTPIETALRDINEFKLVHRPTGDTLRIYAVHLKASSGSVNEQLRSAEVDSLRKVTNALPAGSDFIVCGDFNIYGDYEAAYQKLIQDNPTDDGHFVDPLSMSGIWNDPAYSFYHTQSTRSTQVGGGASGGLDDRFDMILYSEAVATAGGIYYIPGSLEPFGNDGQHFSRSINWGTNNAVSAALADALYWSSDHLPVSALFEFGSNPTVAEVIAEEALEVFPNPSRGEFFVRLKIPVHSPVAWQLLDASGRIITSGVSDSAEFRVEDASDGRIAAGLYELLLNFDNRRISKPLSVVR